MKKTMSISELIDRMGNYPLFPRWGSSEQEHRPSLSGGGGSNPSPSTIWFTSPETTPRKKAPSEALVTFVANNYKPPARFLDIGSGSGANSKYLEEAGFQVISIDIAPQSKGAAVHAIGDIREIDTWVGEQFACIFDIETLQHVENPPYEGIYKALKPGGKFFSIHCAPDTEVNMRGKGFTRRRKSGELRALLGVQWIRLSILPITNWNGGTRVSCWQIEATK